MFTRFQLQPERSLLFPKPLGAVLGAEAQCDCGVAAQVLQNSADF